MNYERKTLYPIYIYNIYVWGELYDMQNQGQFKNDLCKGFDFNNDIHVTKWNALFPGINYINKT